MYLTLNRRAKFLREIQCAAFTMGLLGCASSTTENVSKEELSHGYTHISYPVSNGPAEVLLSDMHVKEVKEKLLRLMERAGYRTTAQTSTHLTFEKAACTSTESNDAVGKGNDSNSNDDIFTAFFGLGLNCDATATTFLLADVHAKHIIRKLDFSLERAGGNIKSTVDGQYVFDEESGLDPMRISKSELVNEWHPLLLRLQPPKSWIGLAFSLVDPEVAWFIYSPVVGERLAETASKGVVVGMVDAGGPAEKAGILKDDIIVTFAGTPIKAMGDVITWTRAHGPGDGVPLTLMRGNEEIDLVLEFGAIPEQAPN